MRITPLIQTLGRPAAANSVLAAGASTLWASPHGGISMTINEEAAGMTTDRQAQASLLFTDAASQASLPPAVPRQPPRLSEEQLAALVAGAKLAHEHGGPACLSEEQLAALRAQFDDDVRGNKVTHRVALAAERAPGHRPKGTGGSS